MVLELYCRKVERKRDGKEIWGGGREGGLEMRIRKVRA
jgi:hypothetical protein